MSNKQLEVIHSNLEKLIESKREAMPQGFNKTRFIQNCMAVLQDTEGIESAEPLSIARTMLKGAFLGLDFFNKECYAVIFNGKVDFMTDYKGERKLARKYSIHPVKDIYAKVVREGDEFEELIEGGNQSINFNPVSFSDMPIVGAFAVVRYEDSSMNYETMSLKELEEIKTNFSRKSKKTGEYSKAYKVTPGEMYKKIVLRRLCKSIELDFDTIEQAQAFEDASDMDFNKEPKPKQDSPFNPIDAEYEVIKEDVADEG